MNTKTFHENYEVDRRSKGVRANPKNVSPPEPEILTADGNVYDAAQTYFFFDESTMEVRPSAGLRRHDDDLCTFGLKVIAVGKLRAKRDNALGDGQAFFKLQIERLQTRIKEFEFEKTNESRSLKAFLMTKDLGRAVFRVLLSVILAHTKMSRNE